MKLFKRIIALGAMLVACAGAFADSSYANNKLYSALLSGSLSEVQEALHLRPEPANPNRKFANAPKGVSLFNYAVEVSSPSIVEEMLKTSEHGIVLDGDKDVYPALFSALKSKDKSKFTPLIRAGANVNIDYYGTTPLMYAVDLGLSKSIEYFAKACKEEGVKLEVNYKNEEKRTALYYAVTSKDTNSDCVRVLLELGANMEEVDAKTKKTALLCAMENKNYAVVKILIDEGADLTSIDDDGNNALCWAVSENLDSKVIEWILKKYKGDFKKLKYKSAGRFRNKNALEIMRMTHTEDEYEDIFNDYM